MADSSVPHGPEQPTVDRKTTAAGETPFRPRPSDADVALAVVSLDAASEILRIATTDDDPAPALSRLAGRLVDAALTRLVSA